MTDIVERLRAAMLDKDNFPRMDSERQVPVGLAREAADEIERLRDGVGSLTLIVAARDTEIERLRLTPEEVYLQIVEGWLRDNRGIHFPEGAVDDLCKRIVRALEPKP